MQIQGCARRRHFLHTHLTVVRFVCRTADHETVPCRATCLVHSVDFPCVWRLYLIQFFQTLESTVLVLFEDALLDRI